MVLDIKDTPSAWIAKINQIFSSNRVGEILIKDSTEKLPEDISGLMEKMQKQEENGYLIFCRIVDVISFLSVLITFIAMFIALFPKGYLSADYDPIEMLS